MVIIKKLLFETGRHYDVIELHKVKNILKLVLVLLVVNMLLFQCREVEVVQKSEKKNLSKTLVKFLSIFSC